MLDVALTIDENTCTYMINECLNIMNQIKNEKK